MANTTTLVVIVLVLVACKSKAGDAPKDRAQGSALVATPYVPPDATFYVPPGTTIEGPPPVQHTEITEALDALRGDDDGAVRPTEFWKAHAGEVRPVLTAWLADGKDDGKGDHRAMRILGEIGETSDIEVLTHVLTTWNTVEARADAAAALGVHGDPGAGKALVEVSKHEDIAIASHAVTALGRRTREPEARARLEELRDHPNATLRARAAAALRELGRGRASPAR
jgi:hypothetical protein